MPLMAAEQTLDSMGRKSEISNFKSPFSVPVRVIRVFRG
jgi:hypothetical protein